MSRLDEFKTSKFVDRVVDDFGNIRVRILKAKELYEVLSMPNATMRIKQMVLASAYDVAEGTPAPLFSSLEELDQVDGWLIDRLSDVVGEANKMNKKAAEKKSETPQS